MYRNHTFVVIAPCLNEERKIGTVVERIRKEGIADEILVVDDGSTDQSTHVAKSQGARVIQMGRVAGVGAALRKGFEYAKSRFDIIVVTAGNNKDEPKEILRLLDPICDGRADFVQGSRFLLGGKFGGDMPLYRKIATRLHPSLLSLFTGRRVTESTNGFRAFRSQILNDKRIKLNQKWLDQYELEPYLLYKVLTLDIPFCEVPVTKIYPSRKIGYTKMKPIFGWWSILRPLLLLKLGIRR